MCIQINWGVSDQVQVSPEPIIFQCALSAEWSQDLHEKKKSIVLIVNHSGNVFWRTFNIFVAFWSFFVSENPVFFMKKKFLSKQIFKCLAKKFTFVDKINILLQKILKWYKIFFSSTLIKKIKNYPKKSFSVFNGLPPNTVKLFFG